MMKSQILKFVDFAKTQTCRYTENKALLFLQIRKIINYASTTTVNTRMLKPLTSPLRS